MAFALSRPLDTRRWDPADARGHVESWFLKANDPSDPRRALWVKHTLLAPPGGRARATPALCEVWAIRFDGRSGAHRAGKASFRADDARFAEGGLGVEVGGCSLAPGRCVGAVGEGASRIAWDLRWEGDEPPIFGFPHRAMYEGGFPKSKLYTSTPRARFDGTLGPDGDAWEASGWVGMLGHNWGRTHAPSYHWAQCALLRSGGEAADAVFEGFSGRIALGPWLSPWLSAAVLRLRGEELRFNAVGGLLGNAVRVGPTSWSCALTAGERRLLIAAEAAPADFVGLRYHDPDGRENHCLNSKIATLSLRLLARGRGGWTEQEALVGPSSCAYEILTRRHDHGIALLA